MAGRLTTLKDLAGGGGGEKASGAGVGAVKGKGKEGNTLYTGGASSGLNVIGRPDTTGGDDSDDDHIASRVFGRAAEGVSAPGAVTITFWKNGFTVDDGDLRRMDDPANAPFLRALDEGRVPAELVARVGGDDTNIAFADKRGEDYVPPAYRAFKGSAGRVGGAMAAPSGAVAAASAAGAAGIMVDDSKPKADIQVRLADGRREKITLNLSHTVADLQAKVASFKATPKAFMLLAGFPPKPLADPHATIEAAGLKGAMVTQQPT